MLAFKLVLSFLPLMAIATPAPMGAGCEGAHAVQAEPASAPIDRPDQLAIMSSDADEKPLWSCFIRGEECHVQNCWHSGAKCERNGHSCGHIRMDADACWGCSCVLDPFDDY